MQVLAFVAGRVYLDMSECELWHGEDQRPTDVVGRSAYQRKASIGATALFVHEESAALVRVDRVDYTQSGGRHEGHRSRLYRYWIAASHQ